MIKLGHLLPAAALAFLACTAAAEAGSLTCRSVNGNVTCAGPQGTSCQTVDGRTECVSGGGDVRQSFGGGQDAAPDALDEELAPAQDMPADAAEPPVPPRRWLIERAQAARAAASAKVTVIRDGRRLHVDTGHALIDVN